MDTSMIPNPNPVGSDNSDFINLAKQALAGGRLKEFLELYESKTERDSIADPEVIDLSNGFDQYRPYRVLMPFRSFWVIDASDANVNAKISFHTREAHSVQSGVPIKKNFIWNVDALIQEAWITAPAQPGKTMTILFLKRGKIDPGAVISQNAGGVAINEGASIDSRDRTGLTLTGSAASIILPSDLNRNTETIQNHTGQTLWLGGTTVTDDTGNYPGIKLNPLDTYIHKNTSALYAYNPGTTLTNAKIARNREVS
jgi:hypothetical protein